MKKFVSGLTVVLTLTAISATAAFAAPSARGSAIRAITTGNAAATFSAQATDSTQATLDIEAMLAARKAYLDKLVESGKLTQKQADDYLAACKTMLELRAENGFVSGCRGGGRGDGSCGINAATAVQ